MEPSDSPIEHLSPSDCWAHLRQVPYGRIALRGPVDIEVFPVNFVVDGGTVVFRTAAGTKLDILMEQPRATFEADVVDDLERRAWSVVLKGDCRPVAGHEAIVESFDVDVRPWQTGPKPTLVRLTPDDITGRRFAIPSDATTS